jgi:hypothetical protein
MVRHVPAITHVVQAAAVAREVRDVAALASHRPALMPRLLEQHIAFPRSDTPQPQRLYNHHHLTHASSTRTARAARALMPIFGRNDEGLFYEATRDHPVSSEESFTIAKYKELRWRHLIMICRETATKGFYKETI